MKTRKMLYNCIGSVAALLICCTEAGCTKVPVRFDRTTTAMGTVISETVYTRGENCTEEIEEILNSLEKDTLSWRIESSEIGRVNEAAGSGTYTEVSGNIAEILAAVGQVYEDSEGALDVTIGPVSRLWGIDAWAAGENEGALPKSEEVKEKLTHTGFDRLEMTEHEILMPEGMSLDLGAVGKGIACDEIVEFLSGESEITGAVISVGGSVVTYGEKPDGTDWRVGIIDPFDTSLSLGTMSLTGICFVSTSGSYERFVVVDGVSYHHILSPADGYPADSGLVSVTVLADSGLISDALSTACFVLGKEDGMKLAQKYGAEALFVESDGTVTMTEGMRAVYTPREP